MVRRKARIPSEHSPDSTELFPYTRMRNAERKTKGILEEISGKAQDGRFSAVKDSSQKLSLFRAKSASTLGFTSNMASFLSGASVPLGE